MSVYAHLGKEDSLEGELDICIAQYDAMVRTRDFLDDECMKKKQNNAYEALRYTIYYCSWDWFSFVPRRTKLRECIDRLSHFTFGSYGAERLVFNAILAAIEVPAEHREKLNELIATHTGIFKSTYKKCLPTQFELDMLTSAQRDKAIEVSKEITELIGSWPDTVKIYERITTDAAEGKASKRSRSDEPRDE